MVRPTNICFFFLPFSGGKFVANCLALSKYVLCNHIYLANEDLNFETYNDNYYKFKLQSVLHSLPTNFKVTKSWTEFMGIEVPDTYAIGRKDIIDLARIKQKTICHVAHWTLDLEKYQTQYSDIKVCKLLNFKNFNSLSYELKSPGNELNRHQIGFDHWVNTTPQGDFNIDIDNFMYNTDSFLQQTKDMYNFFNLADYQPDLLIKFYIEYKKCHGL